MEGKPYFIIEQCLTLSFTYVLVDPPSLNEGGSTKTFEIGQHKEF